MRLPFHVRPRWLRMAHKGRHIWFAWHPVKIFDGEDFQWVWLTKVARLYNIGWHHFARGADYFGPNRIVE